LYINTLGAAISTFETRPMRLFAHAAILSVGLPYHPELRRIWLLRGLPGFRKVAKVLSQRNKAQLRGHLAITAFLEKRRNFGR
jgi:hypothetical protein